MDGMYDCDDLHSQKKIELQLYLAFTYRQEKEKFSPKEHWLQLQTDPSSPQAFEPGNAMIEMIFLNNTYFLVTCSDVTSTVNVSLKKGLKWSTYQTRDSKYLNRQRRRLKYIRRQFYSRSTFLNRCLKNHVYTEIE